MPRPRVRRGVDDDRLALEEDLPAVGRVHAGERLDERRLARAVVADQPDDLLRVDREVRPGQRLHAPERLDDLARLQQWLVRHQFPSPAVGEGGRQRSASTSPLSVVVPAAYGISTVIPRRSGRSSSAPSPSVTSRTAKEGASAAPPRTRSARK